MWDDMPDQGLEPPDYEHCPWCDGDCPDAVRARDYYYICDDMAECISLDPDIEREANAEIEAFA